MCVLIKVRSTYHSPTGSPLDPNGLTGTSMDISHLDNDVRLSRSAVAHHDGSHGLVEDWNVHRMHNPATFKGGQASICKVSHAPPSFAICQARVQRHNHGSYVVQ
jgi:hypothetical protein